MADITIRIGATRTMDIILITEDITVATIHTMAGVTRHIYLFITDRDMDTIIRM